MTIRSFNQMHPSYPPSCYIDPSSIIIGDVVLGEESSVWPQAVIRGDVHQIRIGSRTNIQDASVLHATHDSPYQPGGYPLTIGNDVTVGHAVILHGCTIQDRCLIGMNSTVLDGAILENDIIIGANSLVPPGKRLTSGFLYVGSPVKAVRPLTEEEKNFLLYSAEHYVKLKNKHKET